MAFTTALYYPWIDVRDESWLKNALLYWENIRTIVPESIDAPYTTRTAKEAYEAELLQPLYVESRMQVIDELTDDVLKYLESPEGAEVLMARDIRGCFKSLPGCIQPLRPPRDRYDRIRVYGF
ncbi:hypothetical protein DO97_05815 [Neosynechococcus sphagnicola sy1]|uniref:Uncharacterized protein n=1 Tax=Neosynechococcus sphagnicola sy1 TaxID=1497020 RepID=A0A098TSX3_9CYAN|nr:hypothetical protein [Neosynechococcus sphagnicola]KGF73878.1 hypothetical protein DO97_05815 [Neosynechococcus sphagnicola sy1]